MSVVIVGGNECMVRRYIDLCAEHGCRAKVYPKMENGMKNLGSPDLMIVFTNTISHKMVRCALSEVKDKTRVVRCHSSSMAALKNVLREHAGA